MPRKSKSKSQKAETSFQGPEPKPGPEPEPERATPSTPADELLEVISPTSLLEVISPTSYSFSSIEVKTVETDDTESKEDVLSTPSATVSPPPDQQATLTLIPALGEIVRSVPDSETLPILSQSPSYGGIGTSAPNTANEPSPSASVPNESEPLMDHERSARRHRPLGSDEPTDLEFPTRQNSMNDNPPSVHRVTFTERYNACAKCVVTSWYNMIFLLLLMVMCCSAIYMGSEYNYRCTLMPHLPLYFLLMGFFGIFAIAFRIVFFLTEKERISGCSSIKYIIPAPLLALTVAYIAEASDFILKAGSRTDEEGPEYCDAVLYNYAFWSNLVILLIAIVSAVLHLPGAYRVLTRTI